MTNEIQAFLPTGKTLYAVLLNSIGQVWDGSQFEAIASGTWTDNDIALTEATAGIYLANMPAVGAGAYSYLVYEQAGASPAVTDALVGMGSIDWNGTSVLPLSALALEATLTAIKGAGWTTETLAAIKVLIDAIKAKTDALDISAVTFVTAVNGTTITVLRGDTWDDAHLLNLCDLTDYVSIDFIVKESKADTDDDAIIHIRKNASGTDDGLLRLNKAAYATATDGAVTIEDIPTGDITPTLKATATKDLVPGSYIYDIQVITATSVKTRTSGVLKVMSDVTRLIA